MNKCDSNARCEAVAVFDPTPYQPKEVTDDVLKLDLDRFEQFVLILNPIPDHFDELADFLHEFDSDVLEAAAFDPIVDDLNPFNSSLNELDD